MGGKRGPVILLGYHVIKPGESPHEGQTTRDPGTVAKVTLTFETLRSEALPHGASRDLILKVAGEHGRDMEEVQLQRRSRRRMRANSSAGPRWPWTAGRDPKTPRPPTPRPPRCAASTSRHGVAGGSSA